LGEIWKFSVKVIVLLTLPPLIFLAAHAEVLIPAVYSGEYANSIGLFQLLVLFQIAARLFGSGVNADILLAVNKAKILVGFGVVAGVLNIALDLLLIPRYRAFGAVIATGVANTVVMILTAAYITHKFSVSVSVSFWLKALAISVFCAAVGRLLYHPGTVTGVLLSALVFVVLWVASAFVIKLFAREDIEFMKKLNFQLSEWATHFALT
jgi:O-antigen/teichoic acid export membrane protein